MSRHTATSIGAGVLTLGFIYGAYMTETFRGAILSIPRGQFEAAAAFGMGPVQSFVRITMPQMVRYALPGFTNDNFRLQNRREDWILRLPRARTNQYIDRVAEAHNQSIAAMLGIAPEVAWRDAEGTSLTPTLASTRALAAADFDDGKLPRVVAPLRRLHRSEQAFKGRVEPGPTLARYAALLDPSTRRRFEPRLRQAERVIGRLEVEDASPVPSHNDLVLENLLLGADRLWIIDWEYSAMASPYWDLATLCNAAGLDFAQSRRLLHAYCADGEQMEESVLFDYRGLLQLLGDCWMEVFARPGLHIC